MVRLAEIHELPAILANQISAGEVVERPASVVKELVENSIDAGSSEVDITVIDSGLKLVKVVDDGKGIHREDVKTAFLRHATSKITEQRDLFRVRTLGFRGEALPSISSVSHVLMKTSTGGVGTQVEYSGGKLVNFSDSDARKGTSIEVSDLFYNTPARLKYLKSPSTELSKISDIVNRLALSHPEIAFSFTSNNRELLRTAGRGDVRQVLAAIYGINTVSKLVAIKGNNPDIKVSGYVSLPELTRSSRNYISVILNGRYIKNFALTKAVIEGYGSKLMIGRFPLAVINVFADPALIDVNVHPTKQEVRISEEGLISRIISEAIRNVLADQRLIPDAVSNLHGQRQSDKPIYHSQEGLKLSSDSQRPLSMIFENDPQPLKTEPLSDDDIQPVVVKNRDDLQKDSVLDFDKIIRSEKNSVPVFGSRTDKELKDSNSPLQKPVQTQLENSTGFPDLRYVGQVHGTFLVAEDQDKMYLVDQHAAQERVNYEYYRKEIGKVGLDEQKLLVPIVLDYSNSDFLLISDHLDLLKKLGIYLEPFGANSFIVREHPMWFKQGQEEDTLKEMIDWVLSDHKISVAAFREKTAIMMSCKRAIKANHHLDDRQAKALLEKLPQCENPYNCPHGRPVLVSFTQEDIEKMFKRIQDPHNTKREFI